MEDKLIEKGLSLVDQITEGLKAAAPQMVDVTLAAIHFQGIMQLVSALVSLGIGIAITALCIVAALRANKAMGVWTREDVAARKVKAYREGDQKEYPHVIMGTAVMCFIIDLFALITPAFFNLLSSQMWAAIVDPHLAIALRVLEKVM